MPCLFGTEGLGGRLAGFGPLGVNFGDDLCSSFGEPPVGPFSVGVKTGFGGTGGCARGLFKTGLGVTGYLNKKQTNTCSTCISCS